MEEKPRCSRLLLPAAGELCVALGRCGRAAGVGAAVSLSFSCKRENPLQISWNCQKQVLNVGYFLSILFFFLNYILGCTRSQLWHGGFSGGMPTPSCDRGNPVPQPGSCIGSVEAQPLDRQGSSI